MLQRDDYAGQANEQQLSEANLQKCVASLKLVEPLMLASLIRPGLGEDVSGEEIVKAQSKLLFRTLDLADRILKNLNVEAPLTPTNRYLVAREIVGLVAMHWRHGSDLSAADMAALAEHAVAGGLQLMDALNAEPFSQGEDQSERLNNAVAATTGIMLAMREKSVSWSPDSGVVPRDDQSPGQGGRRAGCSLTGAESHPCDQNADPRVL